MRQKRKRKIEMKNKNERNRNEKQNRKECKRKRGTLRDGCAARASRARNWRQIGFDIATHAPNAANHILRVTRGLAQ